MLESARRGFKCRGSCGLDFVGLSVPADELCPECRNELAEAAAAKAPPPSLEQRLEAAGVPWRYRQGWSRERWVKAFGGWPAAALEGWRPRTASSLLLVTGPPSCGKTGLATLLLAEAIARGSSGFWVRAQTLLDQVALSAAADRAQHPSAVDYRLASLETERRTSSADVLVLDDFLAGETSTPSETKRLQARIAQRYDEGQLTAVTTNRTHRELAQVLPSLRSRLLSGVRILLDTPGGDRRLA